MTQTKKAKIDLSDEARRDFNRRFCEVLAEGFEQGLIPAELHSTIADGIIELNSDYANSFALEARLILPIALERAQRAEAAAQSEAEETDTQQQETAEDLPAWARPLRESLIAALEDDRLPIKTREAIGDSVLEFINSYGMDTVGSIKQFFLPAIAQACKESSEE